MEKLINVSLNFNLREPHKKGETQIYAILRVENKQYKIPTGCKIQPWLWDVKRQRPILKNVSDLTNISYILSRYTIEIQKSFPYLCNNEKNYISIIINKLRDMSNEQNLRHTVTRTPKATTLLNKAFNMYYMEHSVKESTIKETRKKIDAYVKYTKEIGQDKCSMLSQEGLNAYRDYLLKQREQAKAKGLSYNSNKQINYKCEAVARYINFLVGKTEFMRYNISTVKYAQLDELKQKGKDKLRRPITDKELTTLKKCENLTAKEKEYRDLFLLECEAGCRVSDLPKLFDESQQEIYKENNEEVISISTLKEGITAHIYVTDNIRTILERYKNGLNYVKPNNKNFAAYYNAALKNIFRKAGITSIETYIDANGIMQQKRLCDIIGSHFARYTFIYNGLFVRGLTPSELKYLTGHADERMINDVYDVHSTKDEAKKVLNNIRRTTGEKTLSHGDEVSVYKNILAYYGEPYTNYMAIDNVPDLIRVITAKYEIPLQKIGWKVSELESLYKSKDKKGYERLKDSLEKLRHVNSLNI